MVYRRVDTEEIMAVGGVSGTPYISADWETDKKQCCHSAGLPPLRSVQGPSSQDYPLHTVSFPSPLHRHAQKEVFGHILGCQ